jgi:pSer/pThr/pTyr-binding forkhead associated (FHA) protein
MAVTLSVRSGSVKVPSITLDAPRIVIGRAKGCELLLPDASVSHRHASIRQRGKDYIVLDEGSTNGTFVGPVKLAHGAPRVLKHGELIRIGRIWLEVGLEHAVVANHSPELTREIALGLIAGGLRLEGRACAPRVFVMRGPNKGDELNLEQFNKPYVVGRERADLKLSDKDVSRKHVQVERKGARVLLQDLGSKNGATLNGVALQGEAIWTPGQELSIGTTVLGLEDPLTETLHEIDAVPDERIEDTVDPPSLHLDAAAEETLQQAAPPSSAHEPSQRREAKVVKPPTKQPIQETRPVSQRRRAWGPADLAIAALALLVLGLSLAGLAWLFSH